MNFYSLLTFCFYILSVFVFCDDVYIPVPVYFVVILFLPLIVVVLSFRYAIPLLSVFAFPKYFLPLYTFIQLLATDFFLLSFKLIFNFVYFLDFDAIWKLFVVFNLRAVYLILDSCLSNLAFTVLLIVFKVIE